MIECTVMVAEILAEDMAVMVMAVMDMEDAEADSVQALR